MSNLSKLYEIENKDILETISVLNFAIDFDISVARFKDSDLFSFLERVESYDFENFENHDDLFYIINMLEDSFRYISQHISLQIKRSHKMMLLSQAKELDFKSIEWIAKQNGITIKQKLAQGKVLGVKRYDFIDNPENRVFKIVLMRLITIAEFRKFNEALLVKIKRFVKNNLVEVNHKAEIIPNNTLLYHKHYAKFYTIYQWLNHLESIMSDFRLFKQKVLNTREYLKKFIVLSLLHKYTNARILPSNLNVNQKEYDITYENKWLLGTNIEEYLNDENDLKKFKHRCLEFIKVGNKLKLIEPPFNKINPNNKIFMDIFRVYPLLYIDAKYTIMPLLLKQKINGKIINANHTKIIDMNHSFHTLAQSLLSKNSKIFNVLLRDIKEFVGKSNELYYILPDYINVFDFNDKHRSIRAYFNQAFFINKSILAAAKMLFSGELKEKDTLLYFQKNNKEEIYVTPILVRYKHELKESKSKGLYLEKHPSKKYKENIKGIDESIVQILFKKCLQNGVKALVKNDIKYYKDNKIYNIPELPEEEINNDVYEVKRLYKNSHGLFKTNIKTIQDDPKENLKYYKELIKQKEEGFILWGEKIPKLDIGVNDGIKDEKFNLVNDNDELDFKNEICIKDQFIIPANAEKIIAPLFLEDKNINYSMVLESNMMPFKEEVRCRLTLQYSYDNENIYTLIFEPLDRNLPPMQAKWHKGAMGQIRKDMSSIYPPYPLVKSIYELQHYPKKDGNGKNDLFNWVETSIKKIQELMQKEKVRATIYHINKNEYFCFAKDDLGNEIFCHKDKFINKVDWNNINEGDTIFLMRYEADNNKYRGKSISLEHLSLETDENATEILRNTRFPMISIFNGHSLKDIDMPTSFRDAIRNFIDFMKDKLNDINNKGLKDEFLFFCSILHDCLPIGEYPMDYNSKNHRVLAYAIGDAKLLWQKEILNSVINDKFEKQIRILAISLWRSKDLVFEINSSMASKLTKKSIEWISSKDPLYKSKNSNVLSVKPFFVNILEVLLSLLRLRKKGCDILNPIDKDTQCLKRILLTLGKSIINKQANLKSYLKLELEEKPSKYKEMPDLIYALLSFINGENTNSIKIVGVNDEA